MSIKNDLNVLKNDEAKILCNAMGDWNDYADRTGFYTGHIMKNSPYNAEDESKDCWYVMNICMSVNYSATQIAINAFNKETYIRNKINKEWTVWTKLGNGCDADTVDGKHASDFATINDVTALNNLLNNKVDKITGKSLSTNDFTNDYKTKLDNIQQGAQANVQSDWNITDINSYAFIKNKPESLPADGGNADTLDGKHASDFQKVIIHNEIVDFNNIAEEGIHKIMVSENKNAPTGNWGVLVVQSTGHIRQIWCPDKGNDIYTRESSNTATGWLEWSKINSRSAENLECPEFEGDLNNFKEMYSPRAISRSKLQNYPPQIYAPEGTNPGGCDGGSIINLGRNKSQFYQFYFTQHQLIFQRTFVEWNNPQWTEWKDLRDANTLSGKYESYFAKATDINELKAKIKILEDSIK